MYFWSFCKNFEFVFWFCNFVVLIVIEIKYGVDDVFCICIFLLYEKFCKLVVFFYINWILVGLFYLCEEVFVLFIFFVMIWWIEKYFLYLSYSLIIKGLIF